jgi:Ankyrin repeats (3 copies)
MMIEPLPVNAGLERYKKQAAKLLQAYRAGDRRTMYVIRQLHPRLQGRHHTNDRNNVSDAEIRKANVTLADAESIIARWHQFGSWEALQKHVAELKRKDAHVLPFERAVEAIIGGGVATLKRLLRIHPELIRARSTREHRATLLHYIGANAVEGYRQKTPKNAVKIADLLLKAGAEVDADLDYSSLRDVYPERSGSTTLGMVATSYHPAAASVQIELLDILIDHGASVDGIPGCWNPLLAALHNGRGEAAEHLAKRGARFDLEGAAGVGRLDAVKKFFGKDGKLKAGATKSQRDHGFMWACEYGHTSVVAFLLKNGVKASVQPHGETGLHWAAYQGHAKTVKLLLSYRPPLNTKDENFGGTPLFWALYGWCEPPPEAEADGYYEVVSRLVAAGATVDQEWLADSDREFPIPQKVRADRRMQAALRGSGQAAIGSSGQSGRRTSGRRRLA